MVQGGGVNVPIRFAPALAPRTNKGHNGRDAFNDEGSPGVLRMKADPMDDVPAVESPPLKPIPRQGWRPPSESARGQLRCHRWGEVAVVEQADAALVWLTGEVDLALDDDLFSAGRRLRRAAVPILVDVAGLTFADATLLDWLASLTAQVPVTVLNATPALRDLLTLGEVDVSVR